MRSTPPRILVLSEIPTPYRLPLYKRLGSCPEIELEVVFCARDEPGRPWQLDQELDGVPHRILRGIHPRISSRRNTFVYQVNPGIVKLLVQERYDVLVVGGYSVFAEQVALVYAKLLGIPYLLHSESHLGKERSAWKHRAKQIVLPPVFRSAAGGLASGSAAARYLAVYGIDPARIRIFPNTIDVPAYREAAEAARARSTELRRGIGLPERFILYTGRLIEAKGFSDLLAALELLGPQAPALVVAGEGPLRDRAETLANVFLQGFVETERLIELFALASWTVVPSWVDTWGVVVNEALACGSPVIVTSAVGAAEDLVVDGVNGRVVPSRSPRALADAIAGPPPTGDPSRGPIELWNYDFGVEQFLEAIDLALTRPPRRRKSRT